MTDLVGFSGLNLEVFDVFAFIIKVEHANYATWSIKRLFLVGPFLIQ